MALRVTNRDAIVLAAVVLVAVIVAAGYRLNRDAGQTAPSASAVQLVPNTKSPSIHGPFRIPSTQKYQRSDNGIDTVVRSDSGLRSAENTENATPRSELRGSSADSLLPTAGLHPNDDLHPLAVVGRPFTMSPSVETGQKNAPDPDNDELMTAFAQEKRDVEWAHDVETHLQQVLSDLANTTVRSIECRTSICLFEVAYIGKNNYDVYSNDFLEDQIRYAGTVYGYERDATSQRITVALDIYRRRK